MNDSFEWSFPPELTEYYCKTVLILAAANKIPVLEMLLKCCNIGFIKLSEETLPLTHLNLEHRRTSLLLDRNTKFVQFIIASYK